jgi:CheY-like chemotaxis protein
MLILNDVTQLTRARIDAEAASQSKSDFLSRMSHEIRTPMNAIIGMTSIGKSSDDITRKEYCLTRISEASQHLLGIINDILDMSKIEVDKFELSFVECSFEKILQLVINVINFRVDEKKQKLIVDIDKNIPPLIITDDQRLAQVVTNLISNAVKFTPDGGAITLLAEKKAETAETCTILVEVKDTGIGISEEQQKRLFTPFEQADGGISRKYGGTGLGLVISKRIIELMGGELWVKSEPEKGSSFFFQIEARIGKGARDETQQDDKAPLAGVRCEDLQGEILAKDDKTEEASIDGIFNGKQIMIAEDVDINREIIGALLESTEVKIEFAFDGEEAVAKFTADPFKYELVLMDLHMPKVDGYEATRRIRSSGLPTAATLPIIAMTANVFREDIEKCLACGMNDHLGKPVNPDDVIATLSHYLLNKSNA